MLLLPHTWENGTRGDVPKFCPELKVYEPRTLWAYRDHHFIHIESKSPIWIHLTQILRLLWRWPTFSLISSLFSQLTGFVSSTLEVWNDITIWWASKNILANLKNRDLECALLIIFDRSSMLRENPGRPPVLRFVFETSFWVSRAERALFKGCTLWITVSKEDDKHESQPSNL